VPRKSAPKLIANRVRATAQHTVQISERQLCLQRGARVDEIRDRLRLHQIELAVQHRAFGELARLRHPRSRLDHRGDDAFDEQRTAM